MLQIADNLTLPPEAITETFGILARRGAGKTYTAKVVVEEMVKGHFPVVVLDPVGAWWGLRFGADGKSPGLPVVILGGQHGDIPLEATGGRVIADLVVDDPRPLILDLSEFNSNAEQDRFVADFADQLYRRKAKAPGALHVVLDEADSFAPQRPVPGQQRMLGAIEALVRRGRQRGIGCTFITQRPAVLNKNVLTQIEVLITLQMTAPQDRAAIDDWVRGNGTPEQREELMSSLASLGRGQAWFWSPSRFGLFQRVQVRPLETFDSSATPQAGAAAIQPQHGAAVDLVALRSRLAATVENAKNSDPEALRDRVAQLENELRERPVEVRTATREIIKEVPALVEGEVERLEALAHDLIATAKDSHTLGTQILGRLAQLSAPEPVALRAVETAPVAPEPIAPLPKPLPKPATTARQAPPAPAVQRMLDALATLERLGLKTVERSNLAVVSDQSPKSSAFDAHLRAARTADLVTVPISGHYSLTETGRALAKTCDTIKSLSELHQIWCNRFTGFQNAILRLVIANYPHTLTRAQISKASGQSLTSSSFDQNLRQLRDWGLVTFPKSGEVRATALLFPNGLKP